MNRPALILLVGLLVVVAGCTGGTGSGEDPVDVTPTPTITDVEKPVETDAGGDDGERSPDVEEPTEQVDGDLELHHIDVGQADATLIITPAGETILIDTGDWRPAGEQVIAYLESLGIDRIDHLVATHPHADHIGGHAAIIEWAETEGDGIGAAYDSGVPHTSATYERYLDAIETYDVDLFIVEEGDELPLEDEDVTALILNPPRGDSGDDFHFNSVSIVIEFGEFRYVTTGDANANAEARMVEEGAGEVDADVYQAGHHGSSTSSTRSFVEAVSPDIAVISSDYDSQYGHPHDEVLKLFAEMGIQTYWTGVHGDIVVTTDGTNITVEPSEGFSTDPMDHLSEKPSENDDESSPSISPGPIKAPAARMAG